MKSSTCLFMMVVLCCLCIETNALSLRPAYRHHEDSVNHGNTNKVLRGTVTDVNYQKAWMHYSKGLEASEKNSPGLDAFNYLSSAIDLLEKSEISDNKLKALIIKSQGDILREYGLHSLAAQNYESAMLIGYHHSHELGISIEFEFARARSKHDPEEGLSILEELLNKSHRVPAQQVLICTELGIIHKKKGNFKKAFQYFNAGMWLGARGKEKAELFQNIAECHGKLGNYKKQEVFLLRQLEVQEANCFNVLTELGKCYLNQNQRSIALQAFLKAEALYPQQKPSKKALKLYEWLSKVSPEKEKYTRLHIQELRKFNDSHVRVLEEILHTKYLLTQNELKKKHKADSSNYWIALICGFFLIIASGLVLHIRRKRIKRKLNSLLKSQFPDPGDV